MYTQYLLTLQRPGTSQFMRSFVEGETICNELIDNKNIKILPNILFRILVPTSICLLYFQYLFIRYQIFLSGLVREIVTLYINYLPIILMHVL